MNFKKIAMIYRDVESCGGIQREASFQIGTFAGWGYEPVVISEKDIGSDDGRSSRLEALLRERSAEIVIEHDAYDVKKLAADLKASHAVGVPFVVFWHSVFSWMIANGNARAEAVLGKVASADAVITLSPTDQAFFRVMGCRALAIPPCDADIMGGFRRTEHPHNIVWLGRLVDLKRPLHAIQILELLRHDVNDAKLFMLGDGDPKVCSLIDDYVRDRPHLREAVHLYGFQKDVRPYLEAAGAGLVTSKFEGFCHSIVEMKMASLPVVAYEMPYLLTIDEGTGAFQVPQGDIEAAASVLAKLFHNPRECFRQGELARKSYELLSSFDHRKAYERLFADLAKPQGESSLLSVDPDAARNAMRVLIEHAQMGFTAVKERMKGQARDNESRKGPIGAIGRFLIKVGRRLARP